MNSSSQPNKKARSRNRNRALELLSLKPDKTLMSHQSKVLQIAASERQQENHDWTRQHDHGNQSQLNERFKVDIVQKTQKFHLSPRLRLTLYRNS